METLGIIVFFIFVVALYLGAFEYIAWRIGVNVAKAIKKSNEE